jgi:hypothetical protein
VSACRTIKLKRGAAVLRSALICQRGFQNWNPGLFKAIPVNERFRFQFRAEACNVGNHPNRCGNRCGNKGCSGTTNIGLNPANTATFGKV